MSSVFATAVAASTRDTNGDKQDGVCALVNYTIPARGSGSFSRSGSFSFDDRGAGRAHRVPRLFREASSALVREAVCRRGPPIRVTGQGRPLTRANQHASSLPLSILSAKGPSSRATVEFEAIKRKTAE